MNIKRTQRSDDVQCDERVQRSRNTGATLSKSVYNDEADAPVSACVILRWEPESGRADECSTFATRSNQPKYHLKAVTHILNEVCELSKRLKGHAMMGDFN
jgi:hypothetical protein